MKRETADDILAVLDDKGWRSYGPDIPSLTRGICLGMAAGVVMAQSGTSLSPCEQMQFDVLCEDMSEQISVLFAGRVKPELAWNGVEKVMDFNDHPATSEEDVRLVVKHSVEES